MAHGVTCGTVGIRQPTCTMAAASPCGSSSVFVPRMNTAAMTDASTIPTAAQLVRPSTQARPERNVELLTQSEERKDDPFDLPPEKQIQ